MARLNVNKLIKAANLEFSGNWIALLKNIKGQEDIVVAILGATFLDEQLRFMLENFFIQDRKVVEDLFAPERPLATFSARTKVSYVLGLINKDVFDDLNTIRNIRNIFAHALYGISFSQPDIAGACRALLTPKHAIPSIKDEPEPRAMFIVTLVTIASYLLVKNEDIQKQRREAPNDLSIIQWKPGGDDIFEEE